MRKQFMMIIITLITVYSCKNKSEKELSSVNGVWESLGSGWVLEIIDSTDYNFYDVTKISCLPSRNGKFQEIKNSLTLNKDTLNLQKGVITYNFIRTSELPEFCTSALVNNRNNDPLYNFEVFSETVKEHYAFFELNNIDWDSIYLQYKTVLKEKPTNIKLYQVIEKALEELKDNHGFIEATNDIYEEIELPKEEEIGFEKLPEYGDFQVAKMVANHHLQEELTKDSRLIQWGKLTNTIGFIQIKSMWLFADLNIPKQLIDEVGFVDAYVETFHKMYEGNYIEQEVMGVSKIMDNIMKDLSEMESIVIDIRFNGGGQDAVSFEVLSRFISNEKLQVATQKLRNGNQFTNVLPLYIDGKPNAYTRPVYLLTSPQTGSAAEAFSIATLAMENVNRIGSQTAGAMSTALEKKLPNGWSFAISNEIYMDNLGESYENKGIPVDYDLNYPRERQTFFRSVVNDLDKDKKSILKAINFLKQD